jgi:DNA-directed RNA polymerase subunit RPC12/RpoP
MDVVFNCPKCNQELEVDSGGIGAEIECPSCSSKIIIPESAAAVSPAAPAGPDAPATARWGNAAVNAIASSAAAKVEMHLKVPVHNKPQAKLVDKAPVPLEVAAKISDRTLHVKTIRHVDCVEVGHDLFDKTVTEFLAKLGETNLISITTINYSHIDIGSQKLLADYGVLILYKA